MALISFIPLLPFFFVLSLYNRIKPNNIIDKLFFDYNLFKSYKFVYFLYSFKFSLLFISLIIFYKVADLVLVVFSLFELFNNLFAKNFYYEENLSKEKFLDFKVNDSVSKYSSIVDIDQNEIKEAVYKKFTEQKSIISLYISDFIFLFIYIQSYFLYFS